MENIIFLIFDSWQLSIFFFHFNFSSHGTSDRNKVWGDSPNAEQSITTIDIFKSLMRHQFLWNFMTAYYKKTLFFTLLVDVTYKSEHHSFIPHLLKRTSLKKWLLREVRWWVSSGEMGPSRETTTAKNCEAGVCLECLKDSKARSMVTAELVEVEGANVRAERYLEKSLGLLWLNQGNVQEIWAGALHDLAHVLSF